MTNPTYTEGFDYEEETVGPEEVLGTTFTIRLPDCAPRASGVRPADVKREIDAANKHVSGHVVIAESGYFGGLEIDPDVIEAYVNEAEWRRSDERPRPLRCCIPDGEVSVDMIRGLAESELDEDDD